MVCFAGGLLVILQVSVLPAVPVAVYVMSESGTSAFRVLFADLSLGTAVP